MMERQWKICRTILLTFTCWLLVTVSVLAAQSINLDMNASYYMNTGGNIQSIAVGNPKVADFALISDNDFLIVAKGPGTTLLVTHMEDGSIEEYMITVNGQDGTTSAALQRAIGLPGVRVDKAGDKILLRGTVRNQYERDLAMRVAELYVPNKDAVLNMLQMSDPSQVNLEMQVIEMSSDDASKIGLQYGNATTTTDSTTPTMGDTGRFNMGQDFTNGGTNAKFWNHIANINASLQALVTDGKARILSRPNITTMSGEKASILIGGKIPIPKSDSNGQISIDWTDYGIKLTVEPVVDQDNNVTSKVKAEVSALDYAHLITTSVGTVPAISTREAEARLNVPSGMTMAIGGLLNMEDGKTITKVPLLGDIPVLGQFFRHTATTHDKRELIILITPKIVNETTPARMSDKFKGLYDEGRTAAEQRQQVDLNAREKAADTGAKPVPSTGKSGTTK